MERTVIAEGELHEISCSVIADGTSPSAQVLDLMTDGRWEDDVDAESIPDDAQIKDYDLFLAAMEYFADKGVTHSPNVRMNALRDGIWEFKIRHKRFSFYETDGSGKKFATRKFTNRDEATYPDDDLFWHVPDFEPLVRIGHCFPKPDENRKTPEEDIRRTLQVRWEDLQHDSRESQPG